MKDPYTACYLAGRLDDRDPGTPDLERLVEVVMLGKSIRDVAIDAARKFIAETDGHEEEKAEWIADNRAAIDESGGDSDKAWRLYTLGRAEALAHQLEDDVLCLIEDTEEEDDDDQEDGDEDEEDEEDSGRHGTRAH